MARQSLGLVFAGTATVAAAACLPDLVVTPTPSTGARCGDGVIDTVSGEECDPGDAGEAGVRGCTGACRLDCNGGFVDPRTGHCYAPHAATTTLTAAQSACIAWGGHIATIASTDELTLLATRVPDAGATWINLFSSLAPDDAGTIAWAPLGVAEPGWSRACPGCYAGAPPDATAFPSVVPDGGAGGGSCVAWTQAAAQSWLSIPCDVVLPALALGVLCEREPPGSRARPCDAGTCFEARPSLGAKAYVYVAAASAPSAAASACGAIGGRLVTFATREERLAVAAEVARAAGATTTFWIGLAGSGAFAWSDGVALGSGLYPLPWGDRAPESPSGQAYVALDPARYDTTLAHVDSNPASQRPFVCERALR
jgi:hypothetical protein